MLDQVECIIASNQLGHYCIPKSSIHRPAPQTILQGKVYEPDTIDFVLRHCDYRDIVSAGTYFGDFLPAFSRHVGASAKIWAFEPNRENFMCASWTMRLNGISNVNLTHAALSDVPGQAMVSVTDGEGRSPGGNSIVRTVVTAEHEKKRDWQPVQVVALDDWLDPHRPIGIIQLDVEEHERLALTGAMRTIERHRPTIIVETVPEKFVAERLLPLGYHRAGTLHTNTVFVPDAPPWGHSA